MCSRVCHLRLRIARNIFRTVSHCISAVDMRRKSAVSMVNRAFNSRSSARKAISPKNPITSDLCSLHLMSNRSMEGN